MVLTLESGGLMREYPGAIRKLLIEHDAFRENEWQLPIVHSIDFQAGRKTSRV